MKSLKYILLACAAISMGLMTSCSEDSDWSQAAPAQGQQVYFSSEAPTSIELTPETNSVPVAIYREENAEALTVNLNVSIDEEYKSLFTVPKSVQFSANKNVANFNIDFDRSAMVDGKTYKITISLSDPTLGTPYASSAYAVSLVVPEPYVLWGKATITEDILTAAFNFDEPNLSWDCEVYTNKNVPGYIFLKNAYTSCCPYNEEGDYQTEDHWWPINIKDPNDVYWSKTYMGFDWGYGEFIFGCSKGGTLVNGVITFPESGLLLGMKEYTNDGWGWYGNGSGLFRIVLPGAILTDYSVFTSYAGFRVAEDNITSFPIVEVEYGADVAKLQYTLVEGDLTYDAENTMAVLNGILDGSIESVVVDVVDNNADDEVLTMELESPVAVESGIYTFVVIPIDAEGNPVLDDFDVESIFMNSVADLEEVDLSTFCVPVGALLPQYESEYPAHEYFAWVVFGSNIKEMVNAVVGIEDFKKLSEKYTPEEICLGLGEEMDVDNVNVEGMDMIVYSTKPEETNVVLTWAKSITGNTKTVGFIYTTPAAPESDEEEGEATAAYNFLKKMNISVKYDPSKVIIF